MAQDFKPEDLVQKIAGLLSKYRTTQEAANKKIGWSADTKEKRSDTVRKAAVSSRELLQKTSDQYIIQIQLDGTLKNGHNYELDIERQNYVIGMEYDAVVLNQTKSQVAYYTANAKVTFTMSSLTDPGDVVHFYPENSDNHISYCKDFESQETTIVFHYVKQMYKDIITDINTKIPGLLDLVYKSHIMPREKGIETLF